MACSFPGLRSRVAHGMLSGARSLTGTVRRLAGHVADTLRSASRGMGDGTGGITGLLGDPARGVAGAFNGPACHVLQAAAHPARAALRAAVLAAVVVAIFVAVLVHVVRIIHRMHSAAVRDLILIALEHQPGDAAGDERTGHRILLHGVPDALAGATGHALDLLALRRVRA